MRSHDYVSGARGDPVRADALPGFSDTRSPGLLSVIYNVISSNIC